MINEPAEVPRRDETSKTEIVILQSAIVHFVLDFQATKRTLRYNVLKRTLGYSLTKVARARKGELVPSRPVSRAIADNKIRYTIGRATSREIIET